MAQPVKTCGMATADKSGVFKPMNFAHRALKDTLVHIEITHAGVCHSDIHLCRSEWTGDATAYPMVPGHEIVGVVKALGPNAKKYKVGDNVAIGCFVDSCGECDRSVASSICFWIPVSLAHQPFVISCRLEMLKLCSTANECVEHWPFRVFSSWPFSWIEFCVTQLQRGARAILLEEACANLR
eukprot:Selendium_serpulae@DN6228_c0_g1_i5.p1